MTPDFTLYAKSLLRIQSKSGELVPLFLNPFQERSEIAIASMAASKKPIRLIWLKSRQVGGSTYGASKIFYRATHLHHHKAIIAAHDSESTGNIFGMCKRFYDYLPLKFQPMRKYLNAKALVFENPTKDQVAKKAGPGLMSSIRVGTAGKMTLGRSGTYQSAHLSECAYWDNASATITAVAQAVPSLPGTFVIKESTANGMLGSAGEQFWSDWVKAEEGRSDYFPVFCAWWENRDYQQDRVDFSLCGDGSQYGNEREEYDFLRSPNPIEVGGFKYKKGFTHDDAMKKIAWRRYKIDNDMGQSSMDPIDQFNQEYPRTPEVAFIASGRPVFNQREIMRRVEEIRLNPPRIYSVGFTNPEPHMGEFRAFQEPQPGVKYALGIDVAEGVEGGDYSDIRVLDQDYNEAAYFHGHVDPDKLGDISVDLAKLFNNAHLTVEVNNHGLVTQTRVNQLQYFNVYVRTQKEIIGEPVTTRLGWRTDVASKRIMIEDLKAMIRDKRLTINDILLLREILTVVREPDGSVKITGKDRVAAMAIAIQSMIRVPRASQDTIYHSESEDSVEIRSARALSEQFQDRDEYLKHLERKQDLEGL